MREPKVYCFALFLVIHSLWLEKAFAQDKLTQAEIAFQRRDYTRAETLCKEFIDETTDETASAKAHDLLSQIYMKSVSNNARFFSSIENNLKKATEKDPNNHLYRLHLAEYYESRGNKDAAMVQYEEVAERHKADEGILRMLIEYYALKKQYHKAVPHYHALIAIKPSDSNVHYGLGIALREVNDFEGAKNALKNAILADSKNWKAYAELGERYEVEGDYDQAYEIYEKAKSENEKARLGWERMKKFKQSRDFINKTIGEANVALEKEEITSLTKIHSSLDSLQKQYSQNQKISQKLREVRKGLCDLWFHTGEKFAIQLGTLQQAIQAYETSLSYADNDQELERRGREGMSRTEGTRGVMERVKIIYRKGEEALQTGIGLSVREKALKEKNLREAKESFIAVRIFDSRQRSDVSQKQKQAEIESWYVLGLVAMDSSDWDQAKFFFSQVIKLNPNDLEANARYQEAQIKSWYVLGVVAMEEFDWNQAKFYFSQVRNLNSNYLETKAHYVEALKRHQIEQEIVFLKDQATAVFDSSLWGKAKAFLERLLPRIDNEIGYFNVQKQRATEENRIERQKILESKIKELEGDRQIFNDKLKRTTVELSRVTKWARRAFVGGTLLIVIGVFPYKRVIGIFPKLKILFAKIFGPAKQEIKKLAVALGMSSAVYGLLENLIPTGEWHWWVVSFLVFICLIYYVYLISKSMKFSKPAQTSA